MSPTLSDDDLVGSLRARVDAALPPMSLDPGETLVAGRRRRRRRSATHVVTAAAGVGVVVAGITLGSQALTPRPQQPSSIGTDQVAPLPAGLSATNTLIPETDANGRPWWDTGLVFDLRVLDATGVATNPRIPRADMGIALELREKGEVVDAPTFGRTTLTWRSDDTASDYAGRTYPATLDTTYVLNDIGNPTMLTGAVPLGIPDPRVVIYFPSGIAGGGELVHHVEVPTFRAPTADGRLLYAVQTSPNSATADRGVGPIDQDGAWTGEVAFPIFVGSDGTPFLNAGCSGALSECYAEQPDGGALLRDAIASVGGRVDG
ncbi:hypothetical protein [Cellulomonas xylanilytica]|uniref:Uncharacterized protein n=1 Tax=Cellulomonas xylanilytica TaxID=233583 RepID=A0A510UYF9_9CELL|nr:hypothetical protein [Cellulomonas xylanilytica]GEK19546.1 hypothetical protein CXY01_00660 [Cellulomonas xylanilytica]